MNELWIYTTPPEAEVTLRLDNGVVVLGSGPQTWQGRADAHLLQLPTGTLTQGAVLEIAAAGHWPFTNRGLVLPTDTAGPALFMLDDVHLAPAEEPEPAPEPEPPPADLPSDPYGMIQWTYETGSFNLATHDGCGQFTEAACRNLHDHLSEMWGHVRKNPGQNQYNGHAVDALILLAGEGCGGYDIIHNSVSPEATPALNYQGPPDPNLWLDPDELT